MKTNIFFLWFLINFLLLLLTTNTWIKFDANCCYRSTLEHQSYIWSKRFFLILWLLVSSVLWTLLNSHVRFNVFRLWSSANQVNCNYKQRNGNQHSKQSHCIFFLWSLMQLTHEYSFWINLILTLEKTCWRWSWYITKSSYRNVSWFRLFSIINFKLKDRFWSIRLSNIRISIDLLYFRFINATSFNLQHRVSR